MEFQSEQDCVTGIKNLLVQKAKIHCAVRQNDAQSIETSCSNACMQKCSYVCSKVEAFIHAAETLMHVTV